LEKDPRLTLEQLNLLNLTLCLSFGARREILTEAFAVETGVELENEYSRRDFRMRNWRRGRDSNPRNPCGLT
jgi:hypothetical protein